MTKSQTITQSFFKFLVGKSSEESYDLLKSVRDGAKLRTDRKGCSLYHTCLLVIQHCLLFLCICTPTNRMHACLFRNASVKMKVLRRKKK